MQALLWRVLQALFPVQRSEWTKALKLLGIATLLGIGSSVSRAASEALFLTRFGVDFLPYVQLLNPILVMMSTTVYGAFASRLSNDRMMMYTALLPIPFIVLMRFLMVLDMSWVYFLLFTFVLAYASVLTTSWAVYLPGHYDVQEAKRLVPFVSSGLLIGTVVGGIGVALYVPLIGTINVLFIWIATLIAVIAMVQWVAKLHTSMGAVTRKVKVGSQKAKHRSSTWDSLKEALAYSRSSALFLTTAIASIATMVALQLIDFEYSKIFARSFPESAQLTAFLGIVDGLTTIVALGVQWFVVPRCIRRLGVQGTNLLFPYTLTVACGGLLAAPVLITGIFARFTRYSLMPSLRGTTRTLILNAVPRKTGALVRSFNTGIILPVGQAAGAITLLSLKGLDIPILFPVIGLLISVLYVFYTYKQNTAYGEALLDLLREDKIHLLDLHDDEIRQLDATAVATINERLRNDQEEMRLTVAELAEALDGADQAMHDVVSAQEEASLAAIELLRAIGNRHAASALQQHLPYASPRLTAAALEALVTIGGEGMSDILRPFLYDAHPLVRMAAIAGLRDVDDPEVQQQVRALQNDPDVQVRAAALAVALAHTSAPEYARAHQTWEAMLQAHDPATQKAALAIIAEMPESALQGHLYRALDRADLAIRHEALRVLGQLAEAGRIGELDTALLRVLEDEDIDSRELAVQVLAAIGSAEVLEHLLVLLDDEQPSVREALIQSIKRFGKLAIAPLLQRLSDPHTSLLARETALLALARLDGVQTAQLLPFWEATLRDVYQYKLMLVCLQEDTALEADTFLRVALQNQHDLLLLLLVQLLAVWTSPEVARLVESGLRETDRQQRAHALEALESLSERRFTRLLLPILETTGSTNGAWRDLATQQLQLNFANVSAVLEACMQASDKWIVIGALLSGHARASTLGQGWTDKLRQIATCASDSDVQDTAKRLLGIEVEALHRSLSLTDIMLFLKRLPLYSSMNLDQLHAIATRLTECEVDAGEVIFHEGDESYELYLIVSGTVDIVRHRGETEQHLATAAAGGFFGDMAIFEKRPRSATIIAREPCVLLVLSSERFRQVILQEPAISFELFRELSARIRRLDEDPADTVRSSP